MDIVFMKMVKKMRFHQKKYFKTSKFDPERDAILAEAKKLEAMVDEAIKIAEAGQYVMEY
jgi:hypothetical protein